jgi:hypothetical protein
MASSTPSRHLQHSYDIFITIAAYSTPLRHLQHRYDIINTVTASSTRSRYLQHGHGIFNTVTASSTPLRHLQHHHGILNTVMTSSTPPRHLQHRNGIVNTVTASLTPTQHLYHRHGIFNTVTASSIPLRPKFIVFMIEQHTHLIPLSYTCTMILVKHFIVESIESVACLNSLGKCYFTPSVIHIFQTCKLKIRVVIYITHIELLLFYSTKFFYTFGVLGRTNTV